MTDLIVLLCTCGSEAEGRRLAEALVDSKLAACVNLLPGVQSVYRWEGNIERASEVLLLIKSTAEHLQDLQDRIIELHSYDTPEIIALPIAAGLDKYLQWIRHETAGRAQRDK
jgi:periplasmic divalent cation tolerance protein